MLRTDNIEDVWTGDSPTDHRELPDTWLGETKFVRLDRKTFADLEEEHRGRPIRQQATQRPTGCDTHTWNTTSRKQRRQMSARWERVLRARKVRETLALNKWRRLDAGATHFRKSAPEGPQWPYVARRVVKDVQAEEFLSDVLTSDTNLGDLESRIPGGPRDIVTTLYYRDGGMNHLADLQGGPLPEGDSPFASDNVPAMPVNCSQEQCPHREKNARALPLGMIVKQLSKKEIRSNPAALEASKAEWAKLRAEDNGKGCWDESQVREYVSVVQEARSQQKKVHMARLFEIVGIKHWEKPSMHKAKARVVCQGNNVRDENGLAALFAEAASSASQN